MPALPDKLRTPEEDELERKKSSLAELETQLADRELELAAFRADLNHFEQQYLQTVGRRYAILDELKAKIAEARARSNPKSEDAHEHARQARSQAQESARAVGDEKAGTTSADDISSATKLNRSESLDKLYRQAARLLHPDLTLDGEEKKKRHRLMSEINEAYARGDEEKIRSILRDWHASPDNVQGEGPGAELVRVIRKIAQVKQRLRIIEAEMEQLRQSELFDLKRKVEKAKANGRDQIKDLAEELDDEIAEARCVANLMTN